MRGETIRTQWLEYGDMGEGPDANGQEYGVADLIYPQVRPIRSIYVGRTDTLPVLSLHG